MSSPRAVPLSKLRQSVRTAQGAVMHRLMEPELPEPTGVLIAPDDLGLERPGDHRYQASGYLDVYRALYRERITSDDVLVDIGCGRGRVVYTAARYYPFKRVIGIEYSEELVAAARRNMSAAAERRRLRAPVEILHADASSWPIPDDVTHVWNFNAVGGEVHRGMLEQMIASYERRPRRLLLHYSHLKHVADIDASGRFPPVRTSRGLRRDLPSERMVTYAVA